MVKALHLQSYGSLHRHSYGSEGDIRPFSRLLSAGVAPQLQNLLVEESAIKWATISFHHPNLKTLYISGQGRGATCESFLASLRSMPLLETLELINVLPDVHIAHSHPDIALPLLHSIKLYGGTFACANLLTFLDIPQTCLVEVSGGRFHPSREVDLTGVQWYMTKFNEYYHVQQMVVDNNVNVKISPISDTDTDILGCSQPSGVPDQPEFLIDYRGPIEVLLLPLSTALSWSQIVRLTFTESDGLNEIEHLVAVFANTPSLQTLRIYGNYGYLIFTDSILDVLDIVDLQPDLDNEGIAIGPGGARIPAMHLPQLQELIFDYSDYMPHGIAAKRMMSCLVKRREYGLGPEMVTIRCWKTELAKMLETTFRDLGWNDWDSYVTFDAPVPFSTLPGEVLIEGYQS